MQKVTSEDLNEILQDCVARYKIGITQDKFEPDSEFQTRKILWETYLRRFIRATHHQLSCTLREEAEA